MITIIIIMIIIIMLISIVLKWLNIYMYKNKYVTEYEYFCKNYTQVYTHMSSNINESLLVFNFDIIIIINCLMLLFLLWM